MDRNEPFVKLIMMLGKMTPEMRENNIPHIADAGKRSKFKIRNSTNAYRFREVKVERL